MKKYTVTVFESFTRWYKYGTNILHREDGPAVEYANGDKIWYMNGNRHRLDGPAVEYADGEKVWYKEDKFHREDGPAREYANGDKYWFIEGKEYSESEFNKLTQKNAPEITCDGKEVIIEGKKYKLTLVDKA